MLGADATGCVAVRTNALDSTSEKICNEYCTKDLGLELCETCGLLLGVERLPAFNWQHRISLHVSRTTCEGCYKTSGFARKRWVSFLHDSWLHAERQVRESTLHRLALLTFQPAP